MDGGEKVELKALGVGSRSTTSGSGDIGGGGGKKSRDGEGSYHQSERSVSVNSVKFIGVGEDDFGDRYVRVHPEYPRRY